MVAVESDLPRSFKDICKRCDRMVLECESDVLTWLKDVIPTQTHAEK